jgi:ribosomal protein S12 methylthiotransferase
VRLGITEIVLVAQDLARWGADRGDGQDLADLVDALAQVDGLRWIRLMYLFPTKLPDRLIRVVADRERVLAYLDLPFQHADPGVLERMRRGGNPEMFTALVDRLRSAVPGVVLRSTLMTGFPGEDQQAFDRLVAFVDHCRFERLGVFAFSAEEGTAAAGMPDQVPAAETVRRRDALMERQATIAAAYHQGLVGSTLEVMVEGRGPDGQLFGRAWNQAPEVDGQAAIRGEAELGAVVPARVVGAATYDLEVELVPGVE